MAERTLLAFDYGARRIGVAVGQELTATANELTTVAARDGHPQWEALDQLIAQWKPDALVVGVPYHMDGAAHRLTDAARRFARQLHGRYELPVYEMDERLSSREADEHIRAARASGQRRKTQKGDRDQVAARIILEDWLRLRENPGD